MVIAGGQPDGQDLEQGKQALCQSVSGDPEPQLFCLFSVQLGADHEERTVEQQCQHAPSPPLHADEGNGGVEGQQGGNIPQDQNAAQECCRQCRPFRVKLLLDEGDEGKDQGKHASHRKHGGHAPQNQHQIGKHAPGAPVADGVGQAAVYVLGQLRQQHTAGQQDHCQHAHPAGKLPQPLRLQIYNKVGTLRTVKQGFRHKHAPLQKTPTHCCAGVGMRYFAYSTARLSRIMLTLI
ncbi:unknown [Ruminococcus sp. CAG:379]|nr:unknown [Ruminococcus sp. CAG:379]